MPRTLTMQQFMRLVITERLWPTIHPTNLALMQVAVIAALCCVGHNCMVGGGGGCTCMLLLHPVPTSADAGSDLCTLCPDLSTLHPDLWTLCLWCFASFKWCKHSTCTGGGCPQLQLAPVGLFIQPLAQIVHLHTWWYHPLQLALVVLFHPSTGANTALHPGNLNCVVVYIYIYIYIQISRNLE